MFFPTLPHRIPLLKTGWFLSPAATGREGVCFARRGDVGLERPELFCRWESLLEVPRPDQGARTEVRPSVWSLEH